MSKHEVIKVSVDQQESEEEVDGTGEEEMDRAGQGEETNEIAEQHKNCCFRLLFHGPCGPCLLAWPRSCAVLIGVILPLVFLILLSLFFGSILAHVEAPNEVVQNNALVAAQNATDVASDLARRLAGWIPFICFELYLGNASIKNLEDFILEIYNSTDQAIQPDEFLTDRVVVVNTTDMYKFVRNCTLEVDHVVDLLSCQIFFKQVYEGNDTVGVVIK